MLARRGKRVAIVQGSANQKQFLRIGRMVQILHVLVSPVRATGVCEKKRPQANACTIGPPTQPPNAMLERGENFNRNGDAKKKAPFG